MRRILAACLNRFATTESGHRGFLYPRIAVIGSVSLKKLHNGLDPEVHFRVYPAF
jgi:hypothetical protein